jgi:hypothetical protein
MTTYSKAKIYKRKNTKIILDIITKILYNTRVAKDSRWLRP